MDDLLLIVIILIPLIAQIWELVLMWKKKELTLFKLSLVFIVLGAFFKILTFGLLIIKIIFYSRYWSEKGIRKVLYLQLIPVVIYLALVLRLTFMLLGT